MKRTITIILLALAACEFNDGPGLLESEPPPKRWPYDPDVGESSSSAAPDESSDDGASGPVSTSVLTTWASEGSESSEASSSDESESSSESSPESSSSETGEEPYDNAHCGTCSGANTVADPNIPACICAPPCDDDSDCAAPATCIPELGRCAIACENDAQCPLWTEPTMICMYVVDTTQVCAWHNEEG